MVVLAAGIGKRFRSGLPKVLHTAAGLPLVHHVLRTVELLDGVERTLVVVGRGREQVVESVAGRFPSAVFVDQPEQRGTGDAVRHCEEALAGFAGQVLVLPGDSPLIRPETLEELVRHHRKSGADVTLLTAVAADPTGYGRVVRDGASFRVVEEADAGPDVRGIREVSTGTWCFEKEPLFRALAGITPDNAQGEYYLPDAAWLVDSGGGRIDTVMAADGGETQGVNDRAQLAEAARLLRTRILDRLMASGVTVEDPATTYVDEGVEVGPDTVLRPMTFLSGRTRVGSGCVLGPAAELIDTVVHDGARVAYSVVRGSQLGPGSTVGPYAHLRPGTVLGPRAKAGEFVGMKSAVVGEGSKVPHLSYVGDAEIGAGVNVGAGTITANYDGESGRKSRTVIEDGVMIGSDTMLVAPVRVGREAMTGAGSVVTRDVEAGDVVVGAPARPLRKRRPRPRDNGGEEASRGGD